MTRQNSIKQEKIRYNDNVREMVNELVDRIRSAIGFNSTQLRLVDDNSTDLDGENILPVILEFNTAMLSSIELDVIRGRMAEEGLVLDTICPEDSKIEMTFSFNE